VETIIPAILSGLALVSILILLGQGMAIIFGIMGVINLAHGD
jgi:branched-subunit amino acid ABC-type transport system permease component